MYIVLIEADGNKMPTRWYDRLHKMGLHVRGSKEVGPVERRYATGRNEGSVIVQEGAIMCTSESLAKTLASYAERDGATLVQIGEVDLGTGSYKISDKDVEIMSRIDSIYGRRGRPSKDEEKQDWVVTCREEGKSYEILGQTNVVSCPHCHGLDIRFRTGHKERYTVPSSGTFMEKFLRLYFSKGKYEECYIDCDAPEPPTTYSIKDQSEQKVVDIINNSPKFLQALDTINNKMVGDPEGRQIIPIILSVFISRAFRTPELRGARRIRAITEAIRRDTSDDMLVTTTLAERPDSVDLFDSAVYIDHTKLFQYVQLARA